MREVSYSQLECARRCRYRWGLRYNQGLKRRAVSYGLNFGSFFHEALSVYYREGLSTGSFEEEDQDRFWVSRLTQESGLEESDFEYARLLLKRYHDRFWKTDLEHRVVEAEFGFRVPIPNLEGKEGEFSLIGFVDLITVDRKGWWWIWDHKTGKSFPQRFSLILDSQLSTYSWAISRLRRKLVDGAILNLLKKTKNPEFSRIVIARRQEETDRWQRILYVDCATLPPEDCDWRLLQRNPTPNCAWDCEFIDLCRLDVEGEDNAFQDLLSMEYTSGVRASPIDRLQEHVPISWGEVI